MTRCGFTAFNADRKITYCVQCCYCKLKPKPFKLFSLTEMNLKENEIKKKCWMKFFYLNKHKLEMLPWHMTEIKQVQAEVLKLKKKLNKTKSFKM